MDLENNPPSHAKTFLKLLSMTISISWPSFITKWFIIQEIYSKMFSTSCDNIHHVRHDEYYYFEVVRIVHFDWRFEIIFNFVVYPGQAYV